MSEAKFDINMAPKNAFAFPVLHTRIAEKWHSACQRKKISKAIKEEKGCICRGCPVHDKMEFKHIFYCTRGGEKHQTTKTERAHLK